MPDCRGSGGDRPLVRESVHQAVWPPRDIEIVAGHQKTWRLVGPVFRCSRSRGVIDDWCSEPVHLPRRRC